MIDAKLAQEQLQEISVMIDNRFGYGTWRAILAERNKRIAEEKEAIKQAKIAQRKKIEERNEMIKIGLIVLSVIAVVSTIMVVIVVAVFS